LRTLVASVVGGGTWVPQTGCDPEESLALVVAEQVDSLCLAPAVLWSLVRTGRLAGARGVRLLASADAAPTPDRVERLTAALEPVSFVNLVGGTEVSTFTVGPDMVAKPGCAGRAGIFSRVRLVEPVPGASPSDVVPPGAQGALAVRLASPEAFAGYWGRPDPGTARVRDGWYFPGDLAVADEDGDLWLTGRAGAEERPVRRPAPRSGC
jgi:2-furoate---CoA ligase